MDKFFSVFGKVALVIFVIGTIAFGGYYLGKKENNRQQVTDNKGQITVQISPNFQVSPTMEIQPTSVPVKTINGGVDKKAGLSFSLYSLTAPLDWSDKKESQTTMDEKLILEKNGAQISIYQAATGGAMCLYPGDPDFQGPSSKFTSFTEMTTKDGTVLRRSGTDVSFNGKVNFTICQKNSEGNFGEPTNYGHIAYSLPQNYDSQILTEMDAIAASLGKK